jgi:hypothetical protein
MDSVNEEFFEQILRQVSPVSKQFSGQRTVEYPAFQRIPAVHVCPGKYKIHCFSPAVDYGMQFESVKPPHCTFTFVGNSPESLTAVPAPDMTYAKRCRVDKRYARTFSKAAQLQKQAHFHGGFPLQFHKAVTADRMGKIFPAVYLYILNVGAKA